MIDEEVPKEILRISDENQMKRISELIPKGTTEDISKVITKKKLSDGLCEKFPKNAFFEEFADEISKEVAESIPKRLSAAVTSLLTKRISKALPFY